jgi:hypothetical protein
MYLFTPLRIGPWNKVISKHEKHKIKKNIKSDDWSTFSRYFTFVDSRYARGSQLKDCSPPKMTAFHSYWEPRFLNLGFFVDVSRLPALW